MLSETDPLGHTTTHEYDANRNETKRKNARGEETTATYLNGNQTSVTDPTGTTHTTYGVDNLPTTFTDRLGHVTTVEYDADLHVPTRFADELGTRFAVHEQRPRPAGRRWKTRKGTWLTSSTTPPAT